MLASFAYIVHHKWKLITRSRSSKVEDHKLECNKAERRSIPTCNPYIRGIRTASRLFYVRLALFEDRFECKVTGTTAGYWIEEDVVSFEFAYECKDLNPYIQDLK
ncbi:MAG: hypothetical protein QFX33_05225 [Candidatus Nezhaarchaeota archaeon]|nr:hypothetical protein [Candidatus Nezhaarchaeota archaeon]